MNEIANKTYKPFINKFYVFSSLPLRFIATSAGGNNYIKVIFFIYKIFSSKNKFIVHNKQFNNFFL